MGFSNDRNLRLVKFVFPNSYNVYMHDTPAKDGLVHFYDDIYGHDTALEKALANGYPYVW